MLVFYTPENQTGHYHEVNLKDFPFTKLLGQTGNYWIGPVFELLKAQDIEKSPTMVKELAGLLTHCMRLSDYRIEDSQLHLFT